ncbi:hypothetical protein [Pseudomonas phage D6]|nr:hypothetical protein [Pseudomonas phage D6]
MLEVDAGKLALGFLGVIAGVWWLINWARKPVMEMSFDSVDITTMYGSQRIVERTMLKSPEGNKKLHAGMNDFYVTINGGEVRYHQLGEMGKLTPILRNSEDILFFRVQIRLSGERIVRFEQTNLSKPVAMLRWSKA